MSNQNFDDIFAEYSTGTAKSLTPQQEAEQRYIAESGMSDAIMAGLAEGLSFGWSDEIQGLYDQMLGRAGEEGYVSPERRTELLKQGSSGTAYDVADILGSVATGFYPIPGMQGATAARLAAQAGKAGRLAGRVGLEGVKGAVEGAGRAKPGQAIEGALTGAGIGVAGGALGEGLSAFSQARQAKRAANVSQEAMKNPAYKAAVEKSSKIETKLLDEENKLTKLMGDLESEKVSARKRAQADLDKMLKDSKKAREEVEDLKIELEKSKPASKTSPEYAEYENAKREVDRLASYLDASQRKLDDLQFSAPTTLAKEQEQAVSAARKGVQKAEERVFSQAEASEINDALLKAIKEQEAADTARKQTIEYNRQAREANKEAQEAAAKQTAPPAEEPIGEFGRRSTLTDRQYELLEDLWASGKSFRDIGLEVPGGIDRSKLSRIFQDRGVTKEMAKENAAKRAAQRAEQEAAQPATTAPALKELRPVPEKTKKFASTAEEQKLLRTDVAGPIKEQKRLEELARAQKQLEQADVAPPPVEQSRFSTEIGMRGQSVEQARQELGRAQQIMDNAIEQLRQAQKPGQLMQESLPRAEQAAEQAVKAYDEAKRAFERQSFFDDLLTPPKVEAQRMSVQRTQGEMQKAQELARSIFDKDIERLTAQEAGVLTRLLEQLGPQLTATAVRTTGARQ
jgi:hypothetical protein